MSGHQDEIYWVTFSPDGHSIASGSKDRTIKLWQR
ncbi:WD40 repeat domain-containing protein [Okeania sp. SIO2B3]